MQNLLKPICLLLLPIVSFGQKAIFPGNPDINTSRLKTERTLFTIYYVKGTTWTNKGTYTNDLTILGNELKLTTDYKDDKGERYKKRSSVANLKTLEPLSYTSEGKGSLALNFGNTITGKYVYGGKEKKVSMQPVGKYVDFNIAELLFTTLPLDVGYKASIREFYFVENPDSVLSNYIIKDVKSYVHWSPKTGNHETWLVSVLEEQSGAIYTYIIDKKDHRLWQREMPVGGGVTEVCVNEELDYQPIAAKFNKEEAVRMLEQGNSVITGTAFARDHGRNKMAVMNINKAQYAPKGTTVSILPNSAYLEEWKAVNKKLAKKNKIPQVPIDPNVSACIRKTTVYDDKGHFEFTNLLPGEYIVWTSFGYTHQYSYSYYAGTNYLMHASGAVLSSNDVYRTANASTGATAEIEEKVTVKRDGEKVDVNLKDVR